ncbi:hypothetical protein [Bradyrhizobium erythrophlei]|jgi:hypothetical protein|uniref:hypothetical protein n=1 Tax=Bradyrhizobium erythrophlei TaxID=1437360 RepID=UPI0012AB992C|nr:hypothetical protein [Bradyrhizobium erythrophlei]
MPELLIDAALSFRAQISLSRFMLALHVIEPFALLAPRSTEARRLADPHEQKGHLA